MDVIKAEIARKRKLLEEKQVLVPNKKYFRRADLIAKEQEEYRTKYGNIINEESKDSISATTSLAEDQGSEHSVLPRSEVITRFRDRGEPILLFGETEHDAFKRLRRCEILEPEMNRGFRNDFQEAMERVDQAYLDEILINAESKKEEKVQSKPQEPVTSYEEIRQMTKNIGRGNREYDMTVIMQFIQLLLKMWNDQLQNQPPEFKMGTRGKMARATCSQTQVYLKPLLRKLKTFTLPEDILESLTEITQHLLNRNYLKASDAYLQMAIGNAPWPIGVTMVGIHARTGREKIFSKNVAHVMNDETQRKYIQAIKRLMTKCQEYFPTDPSRCVEYQAHQAFGMGPESSTSSS